MGEELTDRKPSSPGDVSQEEVRPPANWTWLARFYMLATVLMVLCSFYLPFEDPPIIRPPVSHEPMPAALPFVLPLDYAGIVLRYAYETGVPVWIACRMFSTEDTGDPMSGAWDPGVPLLALWFNDGNRIDPRDPETSIRVGLRYLADLYATTGSWTIALAAYNGGLSHWYNPRRWPWESESVDYVWKILRKRL